MTHNSFKSVYIKFNSNREFGSKDHYWHFMLGYILPFIYKYEKIYKLKKENEIQYIFEDCGPLMNPIIHEIAKLLGISEYYISKKKPNDSFHIEIIPRWDISLKFSSYYMFNKRKYTTNIVINKKEKANHVFKQLKELKRKGQKAFFDFSLKEEILFVRKVILNKVILAPQKDQNDIIIIFERDNMHKYYNKENHKYHGYGKKRRHLKNVDDFLEIQTEKSKQFELFNAGNVSLKNQIEKVNSSEGIIGIRGAEFLNIMWLKPYKKIVMIGFKDRPAYHIYNLASMLNLRLEEKVSETMFPDINNFDIENSFK